jgi:hypothetical protein
MPRKLDPEESSVRKLLNVLLGESPARAEEKAAKKKVKKRKMPKPPIVSKRKESVEGTQMEMVNPV